MIAPLLLMDRTHMLNSPTISNNRLLGRLPQQDLAQLLPLMQRVEIEQRTVLYNVGSSIDYVYFIEHGVCSVIALMENGASIEVGMIGLESMVPVSAMMGDKISKQHVVIQLPATALKMSVAQCKTIFEQNAGFRKEILRFASAFLSMNAQTSACNRLHSVEQRFARWLLMSADRYQSDKLPLTQDYIAHMLGVRRPGVSETAGELQRSGLIAYRNGKIQIIDREGLEQAACECYRNDRQQFDELMH